MIRRFFPVSRTAASVLGLGLLLSTIGCADPAKPSQAVEFTITDLRVGTGAAAAKGSTLSVAYAGWLYDGTKPDFKGEQFDASLAGRPLVFWLGTGQVIAGWEEGLVGMKVGGSRRLIVPARLAYGRAGAGTKIPPNAALVFDIDLLSMF